MVFGWGKKKEEIPSTEPESVLVDDIPKLTENTLAKRKKQTLSMVESIRNDAAPLIDDLIQIGHTLEQDNLDVDEIDKHLRIIVVRGKKQVISTIKRDVVPLPRITSMDDVKELSALLNQILKKLGDVLGRQTRIIHIFAKKYAEQLKEILSKLQSNNTEITKILKNYQDDINIYNDVTSLIHDITMSRTEILQNKQKISEWTDFVKSSEKKISSLQNSIDEFKSTKDYGAYLKLRHDIDKVSSDLPTIKNQIDSQFTKISRPLGRYEHISSDREQKLFLEKLITDPIETKKKKNKDLIIIILENVRKGILSGSISVKDVDKSMTQITETIEMLESFIGQINEFQTKLHNLKVKSDQFDISSLHDLEKELTKLIDEKKIYEEKIDVLSEEIEQADHSNSDRHSTLELKLQQFTNTRFTISKNV